MTLKRFKKLLRELARAKLLRRVWGVIIEGIEKEVPIMALQDTVTAQLAAIQSGEQAVLTAAITQAFNDGVSSVASPTGDVTAAQEAIDIAAAVAPLNTQIASLQAQDAIDAGNASTAQAALVAAQKQLSDAQAQIVSLQASLASDAAALNGLQASQDAMKAADQQLQAVIAAVAALGQPAPVPAPVVSS